MAEKDRISNPSMGSNDLRRETSERRDAGVSPGSDIQTQMAAISAQKKKEEDEALAEAKGKIDQAVNQKKLPEDTDNDIV